MKLILLRGISGSGKSSLAQIMAAKHDGFFSDIDWFEADMWHEIGIKKEYIFDISEIKNSHDWCRLNCEYSLRKGNSCIVANTFTTINEIMPYVNLAIKYDVTLEILEPKTPWFNNVEECAKKNVHKVPKDVLIKQKNRYAFIRTGCYTSKQLSTAPDCFYLNQE